MEQCEKSSIPGGRFELLVEECVWRVWLAGVAGDIREPARVTGDCQGADDEQ